MKERDLSLDVIRIVACVLVISCHAPMASAHINIPFLVMMGYASIPAVGLFFMISGALLLPVKLDYITFLKHRLPKVVIPTLIWTMIYLMIKIDEDSSTVDLLRTIASIPFSVQGEGVLWFMYPLIGLYLLAPILSSWIKTAADKELKLVLVLWGITLCFPLLSLWLEVNTSTTGILYYFSGFGGYFLLGYALKSRRVKISLTAAMLVGISGGALHLLLEHYAIEHGFFYVFWQESIFVAALCCAYWILIPRITRYLTTGKAYSNIIRGGGGKKPG
ncbi:MAG: acyltransferase [Muribaculaceae bacterium]|nr:acyltransferase [Muribaculaceae bacterium]